MELTRGDQALSAEESDLRVFYLTREQFRDAVLEGRIKDAPTLAALTLLQLSQPEPGDG